MIIIKSKTNGEKESYEIHKDANDFDSYSLKFISRRWNEILENKSYIRNLNVKVHEKFIYTVNEEDEEGFYVLQVNVNNPKELTYVYSCRILTSLIKRSFQGLFENRKFLIITSIESTPCLRRKLQKIISEKFKDNSIFK